MDALRKAVSNLIEAEKSVSDIPCLLCYLAEERGHSYCADHEKAGYAFQDARAAVIDEAKKLFA